MDGPSWVLDALDAASATGGKQRLPVSPSIAIETYVRLMVIKHRCG
jgi:hypothetical protein